MKTALLICIALLTSGCLTTGSRYQASEGTVPAVIFEDWIGWGKGDFYRNSSYSKGEDDVVSILSVDGIKLPPLRRRGYHAYERAKIDPGLHVFRFSSTIEALRRKGMTLEDERDQDFSGMRYMLTGEYALEEGLQPGKSYKVASEMVSYIAIDGIYIWIEDMDTGKALKPGKVLYHFSPRIMRANDTGTNSILHHAK